jgi:trigger factor
VADGDFAVVSLDPLDQTETGLVKQDEVVVEIGAADTFEAFTLNLRGLSPGDEKEFEVAYPEEFGDRKLAGRTVRFRAVLQGIRRKELPELTDDFATELGDFKDLDELREELRKSLVREQEYGAQQEAKGKLVDQLVQAHDFPVPEALVDRQIEGQVEQYLRTLVAQGVDISTVKLDWNKVRESQRERATKQVKASMLLDRIAERESIEVTNDEVDREVAHVARQGKEPLAAVRRRLEKEGALRHIAGRIRTEKTLNLLFEQARKVVEE